QAAKLTGGESPQCTGPRFDCNKFERKGYTGTGHPRARALVSCFEECRFRSALSNQITSTWHVKCHNGSECALLRPVWWGRRSWRECLRKEGPAGHGNSLA